MKKVLLPLAALAITAGTTGAQVKIGNNPATIDASALLELEHPNKALYMNRASLSATTDVTTIPTPKAGMTVYNTNAGITGTTANPALAGGVGFYYYDGARWVGTGAQPTSPNDWHIAGNTGTSEATDFLGTTDNVGLNFRVNNTKAGHIGNADKNTFFGYQSGLSATPNPGIYQGIWNTAVGSQALQSNTTGSQNIALGSSALNANTIGYSNIAVGYAAVAANTTGYNNIGVGNTALPANTTGNNNTAVGNGAMGYNTTGRSNVALGTFALRLNKTSNNLVAVGDSALYNNNWTSTLPSQAIANTAVGSKALINNSDGSGNTANGFNALLANTTGNGNTAIGAYADVPGGSTISNASAIGYMAQVAASNSMVLGSINGVNGATAGTSVGIGTTTPASTLDVKGSFASQYNNVSGASYTLTASDYYVVYNGAGTGSITLPAAAAGSGNFKGRVYTIKNNTAAQLMAVLPNGSETIDAGYAGISLQLRPGNTVQLISTGAMSGNTWEVVNWGSANAQGNIYTSDGSLTSGRSVYMANSDLNFNSTSGNLLFTTSGGGRVGIGTAIPRAALDVVSTGAMVMPVGTTAQRPATPAQGMMRYNTTIGKFEAYDGTAWQLLN